VSVASHLAVSPSGYDRRIRELIPHYDELVLEAARGLRLAGRPIRSIVDLGIGTGALARACLLQATNPRARVLSGRRRHPVRLLGLDEDAAMLGVAAVRLRRWSGRVEIRHADFVTAEIPACDAIVATFSLHHIRTRRAKLAFYRRCRKALRPGGILVSGDCMPASGAAAAAVDLGEWYAHLARSAGSLAAARRIYASWADEDTYVPLAVEVELLEAAGFAVEITWRRSPFAVVVARRKRRAR
jgi:SAM-dependent methyltransferase